MGMREISASSLLPNVGVTQRSFEGSVARCGIDLGRARRGRSLVSRAASRTAALAFYSHR
jgi:hypothetical protein